MSKYHKTINGVTIDIYDILRAYEVTSQPIGHAIKKLLMPGDRGHKDQLQDVQEAMQSIQREIEHLTSIKPQKSAREQILNAVIDRSWLQSNVFQPKNPDFLYDVRTYGGQEFKSEPLHKWTFGNWHDQNSVAEWREAIQLVKLEEPDRYGWIGHNSELCPLPSNTVVEAKTDDGKIKFTQAQNLNWSDQSKNDIVLCYRIRK